MPPVSVVRPDARPRRSRRALVVAAAAVPGWERAGIDCPVGLEGDRVRFAGTSDWRDAIAFDTPMIVADLVPGDPARCSACGELRPRTELWALKQRHPHHHDGYVRFYCSEHLPRMERR